MFDLGLLHLEHGFKLYDFLVHLIFPLASSKASLIAPPGSRFCVSCLSVQRKVIESVG